ncbi:MAG TPA: hypothetical protein VEC08_04845 [Nitrososphaerales archaeon]|nr:hypothetical protein [Nitrososphaerales archaeon]
MASHEMEEGGRKYPDWEHTRPIGGIVLSLLAVMAWLLFILFFALYWSSSYSLFQNIVVVIVTLGITGVVIGLGWVVWGVRHVKNWMGTK